MYFFFWNSQNLPQNILMRTLRWLVLASQNMPPHSAQNALRPNNNRTRHLAALTLFTLSLSLSLWTHSFQSICETNQLSAVSSPSRFYDKAKGSTKLLPLNTKPMESRLTASNNPGEQAELDLSTSASIAFVSVSAALCLVFILLYCNNQCGQGRAMLWRLFRRRKRARPPLLPTVSYKRAEEEEAAARGCVVCLSDFEEMEVVKVIPRCGHVFHPECIDRWITKNRSCPVCRCSEMFVRGEVEEEEGGDHQGNIQEGLVIRLERSRSWCCREVGFGGEIRVGMRRTCSF